MKFAPPDWRPIRVAVVGTDAGRGVQAADDVVVDRLDADAVLDRLDGRAIRIDPPADRVDCVVVGSEPGDRDAARFVAAIRDRDADVPVIVSPPAGSVSEAADVTAAGATRYLPRNAAAVGDGDDGLDTGHDGGEDGGTDSRDGGRAHTLDDGRGDSRDDGGQGPRLLEAVRETATYHDDLRADRLARRMFRTVMGDFQLSIYFKDEHAQHVCASSMVASAHSESVIGKTDLDLDDDAEHARESYRDDVQVVRSGEPILEMEERHEGEYGEVTWLRTSKLPWIDAEGRARGLVGITASVDELKAREEALERERRRLEGFASFASHDLRNPVSIASGYLELASETGDADALDEVEAALDRMDELIDDVLGLVRPGSADEAFRWIELAGAARDAWDRIDADDATLSVAVPADTELRASPGPLAQLLENHLQNAVDHGGPGVAIEIGCTESGFYVADDGPGIAADRPERVFEYGYTEGGTGLGLAIAKEVAELHRWEPGVVGEETPSAAVADAGDAVAGRYDGATFAFDRCILRTSADRRAVEGEPVDPAESVDVGKPRQAGESGPVDAVAPGGDGESGADAAPATDHSEKVRGSLGPNAWAVGGGGKNLWRRVEEYHLAYADVAGDVRIVARVVDLDDTHEYTKAGVLVSSWPTAGEPLSFLGSMGAHGCETAHRTDSDDVVRTRDHADRSERPIWLRLDRVGRRATCFVSADGEDWTPIDQHVLDLDGSVVAGLAVSSHNPGRLATATFDHVRIAPLEHPD